MNPDSGEVLVNEALLNAGKHTIIVNASDQPVDPKEMKYSLAVVTITVLAEGILHNFHRKKRNRIGIHCV